MKTFGNGVNVDFSKDGKTATITINLAKDFGPSKSGKTTQVASTLGNPMIATVGGKQIFLGVNAYSK
jgi:hypothetical protein